jgi:hypothetical protein
MKRRPSFTSIATLAVALISLSLAASASARPVSTEAASKRIGTVCEKRASQAATSARRQALRRRCIKAMNKAAASRWRGDVTAPTVSWVTPGSGATVRGKISGSACEASASDDRGVVQVVMKVDGTILNSESDAPWNCSFDSTKVGDGSHTLSATAYDKAGNSRTASVTVNVANAAAPKPSPEPAPTPAPAPAPTPAPTPTPTPQPEPATGDTTAPSVSWVVPTAGAKVVGKISGSGCEANASDPSGIEKVVMKVDGNVLNTESDSPWNCILDSTKLGDGSHTLSATAYDNAGNSRTASVTVEVANTVSEPAPAPAPEQSPASSTGSGSLVIGIDGGYGGWSETETTYRAQLGAAVTRHEWDPAKPVNYQDALVLKAASQVHTRIHALLGGNQLGDATHYKEWVVAFIRRYGLGGTFWAEHPELDESRYAIRTFELGNEPYFGEMSASLYAETVRPTLEAVKSLGLPAKIILPSRVYGTDTSWMDTLYARIPNLNELFYAFADHPYWYGHDPATVSAAGPLGRIGVLRQRMNEKGAASKPIFITEYGESTANCGSECVSEAVQAEHLQEMLEAAINHPEWKIEMVSVFQLLDRGTNSSDRELQFGLLRQNGTPKPSYAIVRGLMQKYRG